MGLPRTDHGGDPPPLTGNERERVLNLPTTQGSQIELTLVGWSQTEMVYLISRYK